MKRLTRYLFVLLLGVNSLSTKAQIDYDLEFEACVYNDTLFIDVFAENLSTAFAFGSSDFVFSIHAHNNTTPNTGIGYFDYTNAVKIDSHDGPWDDSHSPANPENDDYVPMEFSITWDNYLILNIIDDETDVYGASGPGTGYSLNTGVREKIGRVAIPVLSGFCGDTVDIRWHPYFRGGSSFGSGQITRWGGTSIKAEANGVDLLSVRLCDCNSTLASYTISPTPLEFCEGGTATFTLSGPAPSPGDSIFYFVQDTTLSSSSPVSSGTSFSFNYVFSTPGVYWVYATVGNSACPTCGSYSDSALVTVVPNPEASITGASFYCTNDSVILSRFLVDTLSATGQWIFSDDGGFSFINIAGNIPTLAAKSIADGGFGPGIYAFEIINTVGSTICLDTAFITISEIFCSIYADFTVDDTVCIFEVLTLTNASLGDTAWFWNFGPTASPNSSTDSLPTGVFYTTSGNKTISLEVFGSAGSHITTRNVYVVGFSGTTSVNVDVSLSDSIAFSWNPIPGADIYEVSYTVNGSLAAPGSGGWITVPSGVFLWEIDNLSPYDTVCIQVRASDLAGCSQYTTDPVCIETGASNCDIDFDVLPVSPVCLGDSVCFGLDNIVLPVGQNGVINPDAWKILWDEKVLTRDERYCFVPDSAGFGSITFTVYDTTAGANCWKVGYIGYNIKDTIEGPLLVGPGYISSNQVLFNWIPIPNASYYEVYVDTNGVNLTNWSVPNGGVPFGSDPLATSHVVTGLTEGDLVSIIVRAVNDCNVLYSQDTVVTTATDQCVIGFIKGPNYVTGCAFPSVNLYISNVTTSTFQIDWFDPVLGTNTGYQAVGDNDYDFFPSAFNTDYVIQFCVRDSADPTCPIVCGQFTVKTGSPEVPFWDVKTDYCVTSFPYKIDTDISPLTGTFSGPGVFYNNGWFFDPGVAGIGSHTVTFHVCGDSLSRVFTVSDVPCVETVFNESDSEPSGIWTMCNGDIYYSDALKNGIFRLDTFGVRTKIFTTTSGFQDGHKSIARVNKPRGLAVVEATGDIYFADSDNHKIRKYIAATQEIITVAGPPTGTVSSDNTGLNSVQSSSALFRNPWGLTMDCDNNYVYFTDALNYKVRRLQIAEGGTFTSPFMVEDIVGTGDGLQGYVGLTPVAGLSARFRTLQSHITLDGDELFIPDPVNAAIIKYTISTNIAETYLYRAFFGYNDGLNTQGGLEVVENPTGSARQPGEPFIYFSDPNNSSIRTIDDPRIVTTVAGNPPPIVISGFADGDPLTQALFGNPSAMRYSVDGFLYICDFINTVPPEGAIRRVAFSNNVYGAFASWDTIHCLGGEPDTNTSYYSGGTYTVVQGDPSVLTQIGVSDTFIFNPIIADTFIIMYQATVGCCPIIEYQTIVVFPPPQPVLPDTTFSCDTNNTFLFGGFDSSWVYQWYDGTLTPISGATNDTLYVSTTGMYYLQVTDTISGCSGWDSSMVLLAPPPPFSIVDEFGNFDSVTIGLCATVDLIADTAGFILWGWSTGDSTYFITIDSSMGPGMYYATATDINGCTATDSFRVIFNPLPIVCMVVANDSTLRSITVCEGIGDTLDASCSVNSLIADYYWINPNGDTIRTSQINADSAGTYTFYVVDIYGCTASDSVIVSTIPSPTVDINGSLDTLYACQGDTLTLTADPFGFTSYSWTSPTSSAIIGNPTDSMIQTNVSGTYVVEVTNSNGCSNFDTVITIFTVIQPLTIPDSNLCFGETYTIDPTVFTPYDSVLWGGVNIGTNITFDSSGRYYYEVFLNGCSILDSVDVYVADSLDPTINVGIDTVITCFGDTVWLSVASGYGTYIWTGSPYVVSDSLVGAVVTGIYSVTVTDSVVSRCSATDEIYVEFLPAPVFNLPDSVFLCAGQDTSFSPDLGNLPAGMDSIVWSNGVTMYNDWDVVTLSTPGMYYVTAYLGTCVETDSIEIFSISSIVLNLNILTPLCGVDTLNIGGSPTASGGSGLGFIFDWEPDSLFSDPTASNPTIRFPIQGVYTMTLTVYDSANLSCPVDTTFSIAYSQPPVDLGGTDTVMCSGTSLCYDYSAEPGINIRWQIDNGSTITIVDGLSICFTEAYLAPGNPNLYVNVRRITDSFGCLYFDYDDINIMFAAPLVIDAGNDTSICFGDVVNLGGNPTASGSSYTYLPGDFVFSWTPTTVSDPTISNPTATPSVSTQYFVIATDTIGNCTAVDSIMVTVYPPISIDAGNEVTICQGDSVQLNGVANPFDPSLIVTWTPFGNITDSSILNPIVFPSDTTMYYLTVTDTLGCSGQLDSVIVNVNAYPTAGFVADTVCEGSANSLVATSTFGTLTWNFAGLGTATGSNVSFTFPDSGIYNVTLTADNGGCANIITLPVYVDSIPFVFAGNDTSICITNNLSIINAIGNGTITWTTLTGGTFDNTGIINPTFTPDTAGIDTLLLSVTDGNQCSSSDAMIVDYRGVPVVSAGNYTTGCANDGLDLNLSTSNVGVVWQTLGDGTFSNDSTLQPTYNFGANDISSGQVILVLVGANSPCPTSTDTVRISILPSAEAIISAQTIGGAVITDDVIEIFVDEGITFDNLLSTGTIFGWDFDGDGNIDDDNSTTIYRVYNDDGSFTLYLFANNEFNCSDWDTIRIDVIGNQVLFIPNVFSIFSENSNNATLKVFGTNVADNDAFEFRLFNRWGELIFRSNSFSFMNQNGWDGTHQQNGQLQDLGVYTYTVRGEFRDGTPFEKVGNVTLVR